MPELPEVEAWVRELDPLVARAPVESARPGHVATLKTFDPPLSALEGRRLAGSRRRGKNLLQTIARFPCGLQFGIGMRRDSAHPVRNAPRRPAPCRSTLARMVAM